MEHQKPLLAAVERRKLVWCGHMTSKSIHSQDTFKRGNAKVDGGRTGWHNAKKRWTSPSVQNLLTKVQNRPVMNLLSQFMFVCLFFGILLVPRTLKPCIGRTSLFCYIVSMLRHKMSYFFVSHSHGNRH